MSETPRIAIPMPHSRDAEYAQRAIPQYEHAVRLAGGEPVRILLDQPTDELKKVIAACDGVLLPGSNADVDPARFSQERSLRTAAPDARRDEVDDLLLDDAYAHRKPILGICYGLQSLNVHQRGSLVQHIPDFLPEATRTRVDHEAGKTVAVAHTIAIDRDSLLAEIASGDSRRVSGRPPRGNFGVSEGNSSNNGGALVIPVNSSHHQSADAIGDGLRIVARCAEDGIIEALEGTSPDHFVVAVQWHPERSVEADEPSAAIFRALIEASR